MVEFDVDIGYLEETGELDCVILHDENGEMEDIKFVPERTCHKANDSSDKHPFSIEICCSECGNAISKLKIGEYCKCGAKIVRQ